MMTPQLRRLIRRSVVAALVVTAVGGTAAVSAAPANLATGLISPSALGASGEMHSIEPVRILDTRNGVGGPQGARPVTLAGDTFDVAVLGTGGVPVESDRVLAVLANITVTDATVQGYVTASPCCDQTATASNINYRPGQTVANMAVIRPGSDGRVRFTLAGPATGTAHVIVDLMGWVSSSEYAARGARLVPIDPGRLFDSRRGDPMGPRTWRRMNVRGARALGDDTRVLVPASTEVVAVMVNVTAINERSGATGTWMSLVPERRPGLPSTSNLNLAAAQVRGNLAVVPVGPDGRIFIYNDASTVDVLIDIVGYFQTGAEVGTRAGRLLPMTAPFRVFDTRQPEHGGATLGPNQAEEWGFAQVIATTTVDGFPVGAVSALLGNLTATGFTRQRGGGAATTYLTMYSGQAVPDTSNINLGVGEDVANLALAPLATDLTLRVYNAAGSVHYLYDLSAMVLAD